MKNIPKTASTQNLRVSATQLLNIRKKPQTELEIEQLVLNDLRNRIVNDEMNELSFYEIQPIDQAKVQKNSTNFRSTHFFQDISLIRGTKFHQKAKRTDFEKRLRERIAKEPGYLLLLREIYEKYEENNDHNVRLNILKNDREQLKMEHFKPENDDQLVSNLDYWQKAMKKNKEELLQKKQEEEEINFYQRSRTSNATLKKRQSTIDDNLQQRSQKRLSMASSTLAFPKLAQKEEPEQKVEESEGKNLLKSKILSSLKKMTMKQKKELNESDRSVNKQIEKYLHQGENLTINDFQKLEQVKAHNKKYFI